MFVTSICMAIKGVYEILVKAIVDTALFFTSYKIQQNIVFKKQRISGKHEDNIK